jgi:hypothetical protein
MMVSLCKGKALQRLLQVSLLREATFRWRGAPGDGTTLCKAKTFSRRLPLLRNVFFTYSRPSSASYGGTFFRKKASSERASRDLKKCGEAATLLALLNGGNLPVDGSRRADNGNLAPDNKSKVTNQASSSFLSLLDNHHFATILRGRFFIFIDWRRRNGNTNKKKIPENRHFIDAFGDG